MVRRDRQFQNPLPPERQALDPGRAPGPLPGGAAGHLRHAGLEQYTEGTQRLDEPVSKMTVKFCGGEPMEMVPKYSIWRQGRAGSRACVVGKGRACTRGPRESSPGLGPHRLEIPEPEKGLLEVVGRLKGVTRYPGSHNDTGRKAEDTCPLYPSPARTERSARGAGSATPVGTQGVNPPGSA